MRRGRQIASAVFLVVIAGAAAFVIRERRRERTQSAEFVGAAACGSCHAGQAAVWKSSQHAQSMQAASERTVLGDFNDATLSADGVTSRFFRRGDRYFVNTAGEDGAPHDYEIRWTFGVYPLQQYIVELSRGRSQALTVAWDSRGKHEGGQRWFSLTPGHGLDPHDRLHWTGREYNWNYSCADCHSTAVRKNYVAKADSFNTTFREMNVACEACHGPGSNHVRWARYPSLVRNVVWRTNGLAVQLTERHGVSWSTDSSGFPHRSAPRTTDREIEVCAQCHSRRLHIADGYTAGKKFFDFYIPVTLGEDYYPDGQQRAEDYNYGSFLQSRMYAAGVTCSDCHDPHTAKVRLSGNSLCTQCHSPARYDNSAHHKHPVPRGGPNCTACHMSATTYMEIDARPDHSMRVPRPDRGVSMGVPDACTGCHTGKTARWAADQILLRNPRPSPGFQRFAEAFAADDRNDPRAVAELAAVANDSTALWMVRASALARLARYADTAGLRSARRWIGDPKPLVRLAALQILDGFGARERIEIASGLLSDSTLAVRKGAAWLFAPIVDSLDAGSRQAFEKASQEFIASQRYNSDQPTDRFILGLFYAQQGKMAQAEAELRSALKLDPNLRAAQQALQRMQIR